MSFTLDFADEALEQIDQICIILDTYRSAGGANFLVELSDAVALLENFPLMGKEVSKYVRRVILTKSKHNVYYKVNQATNEIRVLSIVYGPHVR